MRHLTTLTIAIAFALLSGCEYEVPITAEPTRPVQEALVGKWIAAEFDDNLRKETIVVRKYDESTYVISYEGELYRAWHSDVAGMALLSVQELASPDHRKYSYLSWRLSGDGRLELREINNKLVTKETRDSAAIVKLLQANAHNEDLFGKPDQFVRMQ